MDFCSICDHEGMGFCGRCEQFDLFSPKLEMKKFFRRKQKDTGRGTCLWEADSRVLEMTTTIRIGSSYYCPYCGDYAFIVTDDKEKNPYKKNEVKGHCCLCKGAMAELEYKKKRLVLLALHERQLEILEQQYEDELIFHTEDLLVIRSFKDRKYMKSLKGTKNTFFEQSQEFSQCFQVVK